LEEGEDFHGIYEALKSYSEISDNDIIVVENECPSYAYFGELNAMLSIRSGASATIVGGVTRDRDNVIKMHYPVFSEGFNCKDVRGRATMENFNHTITIHGVEISPSDLVFADNDGVVVIPAKHETEIINAVIEKISMENNVVSEIARYSEPMDIVERIGAF
jgi:regulator of RNase E activity RraA